MLLRDDRQMALSQVETLCLEAADHYAASAEKTDDATLANLFADFTQQYRRFASALAKHIRASGDLPQAPDPDREVMENVLAGIKGFFQGDVRGTLISERERSESAIADAVRAALEQDFPTDLRSLLDNILAHTDIAKEKLAAART